MSMLTAAVIGCGPAGLATATRLRQKGCMVTCFEIAPDAGGMWNGNGLDSFTPRGLLSPIYSSMRCVLPKDLMSFSDIRMDFTAPQFPHHSFVRRYLHRYAEMKGIRAITRFNTKVESCRLDEAQDQWKLVTVNIVSNDIHEWSFDRVVVCTGQHHAPRFPDGWKEQLSGFLEAGGEVVHSAHLKHFRGMHGKHVVVVGDGVGAYDCMRELLRNGAHVTHSTQLQLQEDETNVGPTPATSCVADGAGLSSLNGSPVSSAAPHAVTKRRFDFVSAVPRFLRRIVGLRNGEHHAHELMAKWLRFQNKEILRVPRVGRMLRVSGKRIVCEEDPTRQRRREEVLDEALQRGESKRHVKATKGRTAPASPSRHEAAEAAQEEARQRCEAEGEDDASGAEAEEIVQAPEAAQMLPEIDVIVFATGYTLQFPFLHDDLRCVVEGRTPPLQIGQQANNSVAGNGGDLDRDVAMHARGLYLGTLLAAKPSIAFVGTQRDLLPPFMMMEAQGSFVANAFTGRVQLPQSEEGMLAYERELLLRNPELRSIYSDRGVGLHSATYFNVLHEELGVLEGRATYTSQLSRRRWWVLINWFLLAVHKLRSMAPLKRKHQHLLFSNKV